eukprot:5803400-Prymnesium_polylepis.1
MRWAAQRFGRRQQPLLKSTPTSTDPVQWQTEMRQAAPSVASDAECCAATEGAAERPRAAS